VSTSHIGILFISLAVIFLGATIRKRLGGDPHHMASTAWLRVAVSFAIVGMGLQFLDLLH